MPAGKYNLVLDQGADYATTLTLKKAGSAINLTDFTARAHIRATKESTNYVPFTMTFPDRTAGQVTMTLTSTASSNMAAGQYLYALEIESNAGVVTRIIEGNLTLTREITR